MNTCRWLLTAYLGCGMLLLTATAGRAQSRTTMEQERNRLVDQEIVAAGVTDPRVVEVMRTVPRHEFVPLAQRKKAYYDMSLPIGEGQTISAPYIVAFMTEQIQPQPGDRVLEIGTGSGYQAAVLSGLVREVYTIEIVAPLGHHAEKVLKQLHYDNVHVKVGDGFQGWPEHAPFDKIIVTCSPESIPHALQEQLKEGGRMVIPIGERYQQNLMILKKVEGKLVTEGMRPTLFVPMTGLAEERRKVQPDPARPTLYNGDFEETLEGQEDSPAGWYYLRQMTLVTAADAPSGQRYAAFKNMEPGRSARALQGIAVDGRQVKQLKITLHVRAEDIRPGPGAGDAAMLVVVYYDENRANAGQGAMGPWRGTFAWQPQSARIDVPARAREAIVRIGIFGATGRLWLDNIQVEGIKGRGYEGKRTEPRQAK
jgi:protein-L-isoaspartate(D-aspartate) O-methyltransferase